MIYGTGVTCHHAYTCIAVLGRGPILHSVLATKMRQASTEEDIKRTKHIQARMNSSEGLPNVMWKNFHSEDPLTNFIQAHY